MRKQTHFLVLMLLLQSFFLGGCADNSTSEEQAKQSLRSISVDIAPIGATTRSTAENNILSSSIAQRVEAGQYMTVKLNDVEASYHYDGKSWIPSDMPLEFTGTENSIEIALRAPAGKQDGSLNAFLNADELIYKGTVASNPEIRNITLEHAKILLELEPVGVDTNNDIFVDGEKAYYDADKEVYFFMLESGKKDVDISYTNAGTAVSSKMNMASLATNWAYHIKITEKGAELEYAEYLESITATIDGVSGLQEVMEQFEYRSDMEQVITVSIGNRSAKYEWDGSVWLPQTTALKYPVGARHDIKLSIASENKIVQDGSEQAFILVEKLVCELKDQQRVADLTGVTLKHTMGVVNLIFLNGFPTDNTTSRVSDQPEYISDVEVEGVKAVQTGYNQFKVLLDPVSKCLEISFRINGNYVKEKSQLVTLNAGSAVTLEIETSEGPSGEIDYAIDDLGIPAEMTGGKGNGPILKIIERGSGYKVFRQNALGQASIETIVQAGAFDVYPSNSNYRFRFGLHKPIDTAMDWKLNKPSKVLAISDLHGEFNAFVDILKSQNVIDNHFNWIYGKNYLVVDGNAVQRGRDEIPLLWLLYKLEAQAEHYGGKCIYLTGNHDDFLLQKSNTIYRNTASRDFANNLIKVEKGVIKYYEDLFEENYVLGEWLRNRNAIVVIGNDAFVSGGIGKRMVDNHYDIPLINGVAKSNIGFSIRRSSTGKDIFYPSTVTGGTYWLRTMVNGLMKEAELSTVLQYYHIDRVICGHTEVKDVSWLYDGRVIAIDVNHATNWSKRNNAMWSKQTSAGLLIENDNYYMIDYNGNKMLIGTGK